MIKQLLILFACLALAAAKPRFHEDEGFEDPPRFEGIPTPKPDFQPPEPTVSPSAIDSLLENTLYIPITDFKGQIVGYYTYITDFNQVLSYPFNGNFGYNGQILSNLRQRGLIPIYDVFGRFWGFFTASVGGSQQPEVKTLAANLFTHGLYPVENRKGQVIAIYKLHRNYPAGYQVAFQPHQGQDF